MLDTGEISRPVLWHCLCFGKSRGRLLAPERVKKADPLMTLLRISGLQDRASTRGRRMVFAGPGPSRNPILRLCRIPLLAIYCVGLFVGCTIHHLEDRFTRFAQMSQTMGRQLNEVYAEVMDAEWKLRYTESPLLERISAGDLEPRVFNESRRRNRQGAGEFLAAYPQLLLNLVKGGSMAELDRQADRVRKDLTSLQAASSGWVSPEAAGVAAGLVAAVPHAFRGITTYKLIRRVMRANAVVVTDLCRRLEMDLADCRIWVERCCARRFRLTIMAAWPEQPSRRERIAKTGMQMLRERDKVLALLDQSMAALPELSAAHAELLHGIRGGRGLWPSMCRFAQALDQMRRCLEACRQGE